MMVKESEIRAARILIVGDEDNGLVLVRLLEDEGYTGVTATMDAEEVCPLHRNSRFDLIVLDLQMPRMDGFQMIEGLKKDSADDYLSVLVVTADPALKLRALTAGAKDFVSKPFDPVEVKTRIRSMLEVRTLYRKLEEHNQVLSDMVTARTAELRDSEARYRSLTELASDWYWEQDEDMNFTRVSGPVLEMLGLSGDGRVGDGNATAQSGWNDAERIELRSIIAAREPFLNFVFSRTNADGSRQQFQVSGEPMFNRHSRFIGYRGVGTELNVRR